jgi:ATP-dependent Lon protease, bacterial type
MDMANKETSNSLSLIPLRGVAVFPGTHVAFLVGRESSKLALEAAIINDRQIALFTQKDSELETPDVDDLYPVGSLCRIIDNEESQNDTVKIIVEGIARIRIARIIRSTDYFIIEPSKVVETNSQQDIPIPSKKQIRDAVSLMLKYEPESLFSSDPYRDIIRRLETLYPAELGTLADLIISQIRESDDKIACFIEEDTRKRLNLAYDVLVAEGHKAEVEHNLKEHVSRAIKDKHRKLFLQEQLRIVLEELGQDAQIALYNPIFSGRGFKIDQQLVFVLMPFAEKFRPVYTEIIKPVVEQLGLKCIRADDIYGPKAIIEDIWRLVNEASIIIADVTEKNPNVFYEIGLAHAVGKEVVILSQTIDDVPFDLRHLRCLIYMDSVAGFKKFESQLQQSLSAILGLS